MYITEKFFVFLCICSLSRFVIASFPNYINSLTENFEESLVNLFLEAFIYDFPTDARQYEARDKVPHEYGTFDFIIVGAGSTGCVIANRLSQINNWTILVLEAGTFRDADLTGIPAAFFVDLQTKFNWGFRSVPQTTACLGNTNQSCTVPRGKGYGGSSLINAMIYSRGNKLDFDKWADLVNDSSWNYENVLPYFKKSEQFTRTNEQVPLDSAYHGYEGELHMTQASPPQDISASILEGFQQLGYELTDYNGKQQLGATVFQLYTKDGKRFHPEMAFISPIKRRSNLYVLDKSYVTKILMSNSSDTAEGVIFTRGDKTYIARTRKEVILSAGSISSPQILMLSGIGPKDHLDALGISVVQDLPVGKYVKDHVFVNIFFSSNISYSLLSLESVLQFLNGQGPLTRSNTFDALGLFKTTLENVSKADFELMFNTGKMNVLIQKFTGWSDETYQVMSANGSDIFSIGIYLLNTISNGTVKLKSSSPFDYPLIDPNILSDEDNHDIETLYQGVQMALNLTKTEAFRRMNVTLAVTSLPACSSAQPLSRDYWYCYLRHVSGLGHHQMGSCLTGTSSKTGVVDTNLKVFGVNRLRVADASVIPLSIAGHPNAACTMIGEKVSDVIKVQYA